MWVISGPFDGQVKDELEFKSNTEQKLLKTGTKYIIARKDTPLAINSKKISHQPHMILEVGEYTETDVENPNFIPKITLHNPLQPERTIEHADGTKTKLTGQGATMTLQSGDSVILVRATRDIKVFLKWEKVACCCPPTVQSINVQGCAKIGVSLTWRPHPDVNYHLTPMYSLTPTIASSLLTAAQFVKPDWLNELLDQYAQDYDHSKEYALQSISKYRPTFLPALPSGLKNHRPWEPNEGRAKMLEGYRVVFVGEKGRETNEDYRELVKYGEASYECCSVEAGRMVLHDVLAKAAGKSQKVVLIADQSAMTAAVGQDGWNEMVEEAASFHLRFITTQKLVLAVAHMDLSYLDSTLTRNDEDTESTLPDVVLNTYPSEPSLPIPQSSPLEPVVSEAPVMRKLPRRARPESLEPASKPTSTSPTPGPSAKDEPLVPQRVLPRRARAPVNTENPSPATNSSAKSAEPPVSDTTSSGFAVPQRTLKRRRATSQQPAEASAQSQLVSSVPRTDAEPPHKKYRELFEASDPDKIAQSTGSLWTQRGASLQESLTQAETLVPTQEYGELARPLAAVPEEDEESAPGPSMPLETQGNTQGRKRKSADSDVEMDEEEAPPAKRRADGVEHTQQPAEPSNERATSKAPQSKVFTNTSNKGKDQTSTQKSTGAEVGKPDKDDAFLKAVASTKRGKKHEDEFDREFNNLRISKPDLQREEAAKDWAVLDDFGDDSNMRGNFMVVLEMEIFKKEETSRDAVRMSGGRLDWEGRPNYKKFKKRNTGERPRPVEVYISDDEGLGGTWNSKPSRPRPRKVKEASVGPEQKMSSLNSDSEEENFAPPKVTKRTQSRAKTPSQRAGSAQPVKSTHTTQSRSQKKSQPLFVPSDEDEPEGDAGMAFDREEESLAAVERELDIQEDTQSRSETLGSMLPKTRSSGSRFGSRKREAPVLLDDSDDDMAFKGFGSSRKGRK